MSWLSKQGTGSKKARRSVRQTCRTSPTRRFGPIGRRIAPTVDALIELASAEFGGPFADMVPICRVWLNGEPTDLAAPVGDDDEVALLPPVSGG